MVSGRTVLISTFVAFSLLVSSFPSLADTTDPASDTVTDTAPSVDLGTEVLPANDTQPETPSDVFVDLAPDPLEKSGTDVPDTAVTSGDTPLLEQEATLPVSEISSSTPSSSVDDSSPQSEIIPATTSSAPPILPLATETSTSDLPDIIFSEVQIAGNISNDDFVELYNSGDTPFSLKGYELRRKTKGDMTANGTLFHAFSDSDTVPAKSSFLWANKDGTATFIALADVRSPNVTSPALTTDNSLALFSPDKSMSDAVTWGSGHMLPFVPTAGTNPGKSMSLVRDIDHHSWSMSDCPTPTNSKGQTSELPASCSSTIPSPPIGAIIISEFLPYPITGEEEWIEIRNTGDTEFSLTGWVVKDASSGSGYTFPATTVIGANGIFLLDARTSHIALNNTGTESISLLFPDRSIADTTSYDGAKQGISIARNDAGQFVPTHTPTPGSANIFDPDEKLTAIPPYGTIVINEFLPYPETDKEEWIELRNTGEEEISLAGWTLKDASTGPGYLFPTGTVIGPDGFLVIGNTLSKIALNNTGRETILLLFPDKTIADSISYNTTGKAASHARSETGLFFLSHTPTPGTDNIFDSEQVLSHLPPIGTILINELFPNPKERGEANEWIEFKNTGDIPVSLVGWILRSGSSRFIWKNTLPPEYREIPARGFLVLPRSLSKLSMRNSNGALTLFAPDEMTIIDAVSYGTTIEEASYGRFQTDRFRWSKTMTPGAENVFGKEPTLKKVSIPKKGYVNTLIPFSTTGSGKNRKYTWDFGDNHKSYLPTTSHRYVKAGTYQGTLTVKDGVEEVVRTFTIKVGTYPKRDLHLVELCPNPSGKDTGSEWIKIRNDDKKSIPLAGWIIATATEKTKLVNHVVLSDRSVGPGEEILLTNTDSRFTLPNERATIELRRPDGKTAQTLSYVYNGGVAENAVYTEYGDSTWAWSIPEESVTITPVPMTDDAPEPIMETPEEPGLSLDPNAGGLSFSEFITLGTPYEISLPDSAPTVLGVSDERLKNITVEGNLSFFEIVFRFLNTTIITASTDSE